jgi:S-adenosylmethionine hydrolase
MKRKVVVLTDCIDVAWQEIRGTIYSNCDDYSVQIEPVVAVDPYSISNINFLVRLIAETYPEGTIICAIVNPLKTRTERIVGKTKKKNLIFEGTNTGAFGWLVDDFGCEELYELYDPGFVPFGGKYVHAPAVGKIASNIDISKLGKPFSPKSLRHIKYDEGMVMHIDNFGNLKLFHKFDKNPKDGDKFRISINDKTVNTVYNTRIMARDDGERIIYSGSSFGFTEIGIVRGNFAKTYNVKNDDIMNIERID